MKTKHLYLILCILGLILPYSQMIPFYNAYGMDMVLLFQKQFAEPAVAFFGFDLMVAVLAVISFIIFEAKRLKIKYFWIPIIGIFGIGVAFGFPLFLYMREGYLKKS